MIRRPPRSTRTDTLFPYTTLFRSVCRAAPAGLSAGECLLQRGADRPGAAVLLLSPEGRDFRCCRCPARDGRPDGRSEEHTSELQSLMRISYAVFCLKKKKRNNTIHQHICNNITIYKSERTTS